MLRRPYSTLYLDVLMNLVALLFLLVNPIPREADAKPRAEYTLTMLWTGSEQRLDIDLYVRLPNGKVVWYSAKDQGLVFIDRDHLGRIEDGPIRREDVQWVQPVIPGSYFVSVNNYRGVAVGETILELRDANGKLLWSHVMPTPPDGTEIPIVEFVFGQDGKLFEARPSTTSVRQLRNSMS